MIKHSGRAAWITGVLLSALLWAQPAGAQAPGGFVRINGIYPVSDPATFEKTIERALYEETAEYRITQGPANRIFADATVGARIWQDLAAAVSVSFLDTHSRTLVSGMVPSPLIFDSMRTVSYTGAVKHRQMDFHLQAVYFLPTPEAIDIALSAGPSLLRITRDSVSSPTLGPETFPFETIGITGLDTTPVRESGIGANVGVDIAFMPVRVFGVGIFARYVTGSVDAGAREIDAGGFQAGAGLRFRF